jgi:hypothetical protein
MGGGGEEKNFKTLEPLLASLADCFMHCEIRSRQVKLKRRVKRDAFCPSVLEIHTREGA